MRRVGYLWPQILEWANLRLAYHRAARGKADKLEVRRFSADLDTHLAEMRIQLLEDDFIVGCFHKFEVHEPKKRTIHAARFPERVFHHALMNVCEPVFERHLVHHTYACRKGKGRLKALDHTSCQARRNAWYLKLDIRKYFESIPHAELIVKVRCLFKDPQLLVWLERIIHSHRGPEERGLPIGSLTSQHLANFYLSGLDRLCQSLPGVKGYVRYMDDFVCWSPGKAPLLNAGKQIETYLREHLSLTLKHPPAPQRSVRGMDFLGFRIFPTHRTLKRASKTRYRRRLRILDRLHANGTLSQSSVQNRLTALTAFTLPARAWHFRQRTLAQFRSSAIGHEPGEPGRQLEQQRHQLPHCESQQEQPGQPQQQHRLPPGPQLRPNPPDGANRHHQGTEPAADPL